MNQFLEVSKVSKSFNGKEIYKNVSFSFGPGCYAVLGHNGAGKSVLMRMLAGVLKQDHGIIRLHQVGHNTSVQYKQLLTYIPGQPHFFPNATGHEFLSFICSIRKDQKFYQRLRDLTDNYQLSSYLKNKFSDMSLGTQKKLFLATLAIGRSRLIVMDEPTNALDEASKKILSAQLNKLCKDTIIIIATHDNNFLSSIKAKKFILNEVPVCGVLNYV